MTTDPLLPADGLPLTSNGLGVLCFGGVECDRFRLAPGHGQPVADLSISQTRADRLDQYSRRLEDAAVVSHSFRTVSAHVDQEAWISAPHQALIVRRQWRQSHDLPVLLRLNAVSAHASVSPAIGGLDLVVAAPVAVVALRVIGDGAMTYVDGRIRLDMATWMTLIAGTAGTRREVDDRLCALAVDLVRPRGYAGLRPARSKAMR
jgi:Glycosyl hydrolase family 65, N-terminal domain